MATLVFRGGRLGKFLITLYVAVLTSISAIAKVKTEVIEYKHGDTVLEG